MIKKEAKSILDVFSKKNKKVSRQQQILNLVSAMGGVSHGTVKHMIVPEAKKVIKGARQTMPKIF